MPATIVVGGQFGSEGKGKVAHHLAASRGARAAVRVGGPNSGHSTMAPAASRRILRQLPTAAVLADVLCVVPAGAYVDPPVLLREIAEVALAPERLIIDPAAMVVLEQDRRAEEASGLGTRIGSTCSGTGAAVVRRVERSSNEHLAAHHPELKRYVRPVAGVLRDILDADDRVVIEGTQGFGLSLLHSPYYPKATSRDTSAAAALSETGLSPFDVDEVVLVLRAFPIRVAGDSGPFGAPEIDWGTVAAEGGHHETVAEFTSVTGRLRRVARFDPELVRQAILVNRPTSIVLNHVDQVDARARRGELTSAASDFVAWVAEAIGQPVDLVGLGPHLLVSGGVREAVAVQG